jgi:alanine dehydrogenase
MRIGIPKEIKDNESRVALTPAGAHELIAHGHEVLIETDAGAASSLPDDDYLRVGAKIATSAAEVWSSAEMICKVKEPLEIEYPLLGRDQILFTYLHLAASRSCTDALLAAGTTAIAYETVQAADGSLPLLAPMSEIAGRMAPLAAAEHLQRPRGGRGVLMSGVAGVRPARVVVIGAGVAGANAAAIAAGMHADVVVLDRDIAKLRALDALYRGQLETLASSAHSLEEVCLGADVVIGAVLVAGARAPRLVSDDLVAAMRPGSVLIDIAVDQGGCFESTHPTTHTNPTFRVHGSLFYCVANMPGAVPHTSTHALTNATLSYILEVANVGWRRAAMTDPSLAAGVNSVGGVLTNASVAEAHGLSAVALTELT